MGFRLWLGCVLILSACAPVKPVQILPVPNNSAAVETPVGMPTALPTREPYAPGTLVDYIAQTGDSLPALAQHFNTSVDEIRAANPIIPDDVSTLPAGLPMKIPIYYLTLWGTAYQIIPDSLFINGPAQKGFDTVSYVDSMPGWLKNYSTFAGGETRRGGALVQYYADSYSISPRLLLTLIELHAGGLTHETALVSPDEYPFGYSNYQYKGLGQQLVWAANTLNNGYYGWRTGQLTSFEHPDGTLERPDPWQNAATVGLQYYFSRLYSGDFYTLQVSGNGFAALYQTLFGNPWENVQSHIPGSLQQPEFQLPFEVEKTWTYTGGPHTGWGSGEPFAALDFAPSDVTKGCVISREWATAVADGVVVRTGDAMIAFDLDGDSDEHTGWVIIYLHLSNQSLPPLGKRFLAGDALGIPSCEGGRATGTHVHIARKYNGEWMAADSAVPFNLDGWIAHNGSEAYLGTLERQNEIVTACDCSNAESQIKSEP